MRYRAAGQSGVSESVDLQRGLVQTNAPSSRPLKKTHARRSAGEDSESHIETGKGEKIKKGRSIDDPIKSSGNYNRFELESVSARN